MCSDDEYRDSVSGRCLQLCGEGQRCGVDEYCDQVSRQCTNLCGDRCTPAHLYCDPLTSNCHSCLDVCDTLRIHLYPECRLNCPDMYERLKSGIHHDEMTSLALNTPPDTVRQAEVDMVDFTVSTALIGVAAVILAVTIICITITTIRFYNNRKQSNHINQAHSVEECVAMAGDSPADNVPKNNTPPPTPGASVTGPADDNPNLRNPYLQQSPDVMQPRDEYNADVHRMHYSIEVSNPAPVFTDDARSAGRHTQEQPPLDVDESLLSFAYVSVDLGTYSAPITFSAYDVVDAPATTAQAGTRPPIDFQAQIREIKDMNWGSIGDLDLREDDQEVIANNPLFCPGMRLATPTPSMQARIDERVRVIEILDKLDYVLYHMFSQDSVTVVIRPGDVTLGEARRQIVDLGIPEQDFTLEICRYDSTDTDTGYC